MDSQDMQRIGQILKNRRNELGYTQEFAAEISEISYSYYTKIERGEQLPSLEVCIHLAQVFHLSLDYWILNSQSEYALEITDFLNCMKSVDKQTLKDMEMLFHKISMITK